MIQYIHSVGQIDTLAQGAINWYRMVWFHLVQSGREWYCLIQYRMVCFYLLLIGTKWYSIRRYSKLSSMCCGLVAYGVPGGTSNKRKEALFDQN